MYGFGPEWAYRGWTFTAEFRFRIRFQYGLVLVRCELVYEFESGCMVSGPHGHIGGGYVLQSLDLRSDSSLDK